MSNISETAPASERQNPTEKARAELRELERENDLKVESERDEHWKYIDLGKLSAEEAGLWNSFAAARTSQELEEATAGLRAYRHLLNARFNEIQSTRPDFDRHKTHGSAFVEWLANRMQLEISEAEEHIVSGNEIMDRR
ncbi:MAG: hypothetical protein UY99_C0021G0007 [Parcubacteria group bacterium GW2011_GWA1_59_11]|nr:MAG: hypothetical protein UY99_C0021G0007 [Parcubacteria group bacterium GW2011_GWA1_59_11]